MKTTFIIAFILLSELCFCQLSDLNIKNTSSYRSRGRYNWRIYIDASSIVLNSIDTVRYTLHPTFREPIVYGNARDKFSYSAIGWGEFNVIVKIIYRDKRKQPQVFNHWLNL